MDADIVITAEDRERLTLALGYATGAAMNAGERRLAYGFLDLANRLHRNNPRWRAYEVPKSETEADHEQDER